MRGLNLGESDIQGAGGRRQLSQGGDEPWAGNSTNQSELLYVREMGNSVRKVDGYIGVDITEE
jgi:hypothetical protein